MGEDIISYIKILSESLEKKDKLLNQIIELTREQEAILNASDFDVTAFDMTMDAKQNLIEQLEQLDSGFENIYNRIKDEIVLNKEKYQSYIISMQNTIGNLTKKSVIIKALEEQNKIKVQTCLANQRQQIKQIKKSSQTAASYYKNMADQHHDQSYFLDKKK